MQTCSAILKTQKHPFVDRINLVWAIILVPLLVHLPWNHPLHHCTQRLLLGDVYAFSIKWGLCLVGIFVVIFGGVESILMWRRMVALNLVVVRKNCLELECNFFIGIFVAFGANFFSNATHLEDWVVNVPKPMVCVDGDNNGLGLIVACTLPCHFHIGCCRRLGFVAPTWAIAIEWQSCAIVWW